MSEELDELSGALAALAAPGPGDLPEPAWRYPPRHCGLPAMLTQVRQSGTARATYLFFRCLKPSCRQDVMTIVCWGDEDTSRHTWRYTTLVSRMRRLYGLRNSLAAR